MLFCTNLIAFAAPKPAQPLMDAMDKNRIKATDIESIVMRNTIA
jgi:hypothetical protein